MWGRAGPAPAGKRSGRIGRTEGRRVPAAKGAGALSHAGSGSASSTPVARRGSGQATEPSIASASSSRSVMITSVVSMRPDTEEALRIAVVTTRAGSMMPAFTRSS